MTPIDNSTVAEQLETPVDTTSLQPLPDEPAPAHDAFVAFFRLGQDRSLKAVAEKCGSSIDTIKKWSSRFGWKDRINAFNTGILQQYATTEAAIQRRKAAEWSARMEAIREQQFIAAQKLLTVVQCYLETFDDEQLGKMTLSQASNALVVASKIGRMALQGFENPKQAGSVSQCETMPSVSAPIAVATSAQVPQADATPVVDSTDLKVPPVAKAEKLFSGTDSAEKCVPEPARDVQKNQVRPSNPGLAPCPSSLPLCPSRRSRRRHKNSVRAKKCRRVPFGYVSGISQNQSCTISASFLHDASLARGNVNPRKANPPNPLNRPRLKLNTTQIKSYTEKIQKSSLSTMTPRKLYDPVCARGATGRRRILAADLRHIPRAPLFRQLFFGHQFHSPEINAKSGRIEPLIQRYAISLSDRLEKCWREMTAGDAQIPKSVG